MTVGGVLTNLHTNPSFETTYGSVDVWTNLATHPRGIATGVTGAQLGVFTGRWFGASGGAGTHTLVTGATDGPVGITQYLRKSWTAAPTGNGDTGFQCSSGTTTSTNTDGYPVTAGATYTLSGYMRTSASSKGGSALQVYFHDAGGVYLSMTASTSLSLPTGVWVRHSLTFTVPANAVKMTVALDVDSGTAWAAGDTLDATGIMLTQTPILLPYFDGALAPALRTNLVPNPCKTSGTAVNGWVLGNQWYGSGGTGSLSYVSGVTDGPVDSPTAYLRKTWTAVGTGSIQLGYQMHGTTRTPVFPGETYTISAWWRHNNPIKPDSVSARVYFFGAASGGSSLSSQLQSFSAPDAGVWQRLSLTFTVPAGASYIEPIPVYCNWTNVGQMFVGMTVDCTAALAERSSVLGDFFDGNSGYGYRWAGTANASPSEKYDADLTPAWAGAANASTSAARGVLVSGAGAGAGRAVITSKNWAANGQRSIRIISNASTSDGGGCNIYQFTADQVGKTFTVLATCRVPETQTSPGATARSIYTLDPAVTTGPQAPNVPGVYPLRWTFTPTAAGQTLRLGGNATVAGRGDTYWDSVLLLEGADDGQVYFDGSTNPSPDEYAVRWSGGADASVSVMTRRVEMPPIAIRLHAYLPGTDTSLGILPSPLSWQASFVHNNDGALELRYSELAENGAIAARGIEAGLDIALEVNVAGGANDWFEPDNARYLLIDDKDDRSDAAKVHTLTMPSWSWLLNKICDLNTGALAGTKSTYAGQRLFPATSDAGDVVKKMLDEHDARTGPAVPVLRDSWTTTVDSGGHTWAKKLGKNAEGRAFPAGQPLHAKLDALTRNGLCDWRTRGRAIRIYNPSTASTDRSATVHLRYGDDLTDAPSQTSQADRVARLLVRGDGKHKVTATDPTVPEHYGRWEAMLDAAGVKDDDDLEEAGTAELADRNRIKGQYTRTLTMAGRFLPFRDYVVGDWVTAPGADGDEVLRIMQITITRDEQGGLGGNLILGDRFTNSDLALAGRVSAITGGTTGVSGNGTTASPAGPDVRQPSAPTGLSVTGELYLNPFGQWKVRGRFSWSAVTTATDGTALDVSRYEILGQEQTTPASEWRALSATSGNGTALTVEEFRVASSWLFTVRAYGTTTTEAGVQSATASITFGTDTTAPNTPATPTATSYLGAAVIGWSGLDSGGAAMPLDFVRCEVHLSTSSGFAPVLTASSATRKASFLRGGTVTLNGLTYGTTYYVKLVAVDQSGNYSTASAQASVVPVQATASDISAAYTALITAAQATADSKVTTFTGASTPTALAVGDLWINAGIVKRATAAGTGSWVTITDVPSLAATAAASATAGLVTTFYASTAPSATHVGDIWINSTTGAVSRASATGTGSWQATSLAQSAVAGLVTALGDLQTQTDAKIKTYAQTAAPTGLTTADAGDLWIDTDDGNKLYRYSGSAWVAVQDSAIAAAASAAANAQSTADAKSRNFRSEPTTPYSLGDTWTDAGTVWVCTTARASGSFVSGDWTASATTADTTARSEAAAATDTFTSTPAPPYKTGDLWRDSNSILWVCTTSRATGSFNSADWSLQTITAAMMAATDIFTINLYTGPPTGTHARVTPGGFTAWAANPDNAGAIEDWLRIGDASAGNAISIGYDTDNPVASISAAGHAIFQSLSTGALQIAGDTLQTYLDRLPRGRLAYTFVTSPVSGIGTTATQIIELRCVMQPGRLYDVRVLPHALRSSVNGDHFQLNLRYALDGAAVTATSTLISQGSYAHQVSSDVTKYCQFPGNVGRINTGAWSDAREVRFGYYMHRDAGTGTGTAYGSADTPVVILVDDVGPAMDATTTAILRTSVWNCSAMYRDGAGSPVTSVNVVNDADYVFAHALFNSNAISGEPVSVATAMSGATIVKAEIGTYISKTDNGNPAFWRLYQNTATAATPTTAGSYVDTTPGAQYAPSLQWFNITSIWTASSRSIHLHDSTGDVAAWRTLLNTTTHPLQLRLTYLR